MAVINGGLGPRAADVRGCASGFGATGVEAILSLFDICFSKVESGYIEVSRGGVQRKHRSWVPVGKGDSPLLELSSPQGQFFFGPAVRINSGTLGKANCLGSQVCWVDIDRTDRPVTLLPPTAVVWSGHGWHLYWALNEFCSDISLVEQVNASLAKSVQADSAHNIDRLLRVPGSLNMKDPAHPVECETIVLNADISYPIKILLSSGAVSQKALHKIVTGDSRGYRTKSERDWAIVKELIGVGLDDTSIHYIFQVHACGDKYRDPQDGGEKYLKRTLEGARGRAGGSKPEPPFVERQNCYYARKGAGFRQVSTFTLTPTLLLEGKEGDSIYAQVSAYGTPNVGKVVFPRASFSRVGALSSHLPRTSWVWLGNDSDVRALLAHLSRYIQSQGIPTAVQSHILGYHELGGDGGDPDTAYLITDGCILSSSGEVFRDPQESPIMYVPTRREAPSINLRDDPPSKQDYAALARLLPQLNEPGRIWPIIGWFMATPMKVRLNQLGYRFPTLNVCGTKGSGKTTVIHSMLAALGNHDPCSYNVDTTKFVALSLLGSSNVFPVSFSEFRAVSARGTASDFLRYIRLAYDIGKDARGRPNQTTVEYPLIAPMVVDGEDKVEDPAILERSIVVVLSPHTIDEGEGSWIAFQEMREGLDLDAFALPYLQYSLTSEVAMFLDEAEQALHEAFPERLPDRVRRNLIVCWTGVLLFSDFMSRVGQVDCHPREGVKVLRECLENVYSMALKRAPVAADAFAEYVVNQAAGATNQFPWVMDKGVLWFQCTPAYEAYVSSRVRQRQTVLSKNALIGQLYELKDDYIVDAEVRNIKGSRVLAFGVDITQAHDAGLDVPESFTSKSIVFDF